MLYPLRGSQRERSAKRYGIIYDFFYYFALARRHSIVLYLTILFLYIIKSINQLHAVSRTQRGRQREPSVKTLRSPLSAEVWSGRTQRRA